MKGLYLCWRDHNPLKAVNSYLTPRQSDSWRDFLPYRPSSLSHKLEAGDGACNSHERADKQNPTWRLRCRFTQESQTYRKNKIYWDCVRPLLGVFEAEDANKKLHSRR